MENKRLLIETLDFWKYKLDNNLCTPEEITSFSKMVTENLDVLGTVEDLAKHFGVSEGNVRTVINRKVFGKPKRRVYYRFLEFLKVVPEKWRKK